MAVSRTFLFALLFILVSGSGAGYDDLHVDLFVQDGSSLDGFAVHYRLLSSSGFVINGSSVLLNDSFLIKDVEEGDYFLFVEVDDSLSVASDFYGSFPVSIVGESFASGFVFPTGSLSLSIFDSKSKPVKGALLKVECLKKYGVQGYFKSDEFGSLSLNQLPVSSCMVYSALGNEVKKQSVNISRGGLANVEFLFEEYDSSNSSFSVLLFFFIVVLVFVVFVLGLYFFKGKKYFVLFNSNFFKGVDESDVSFKKIVSSSKDDILVALSDSERKVVVFLLNEKKNFSGGDFFVNQAKIIYGVGVPKTTLVRLLSSLEKKNILEVEKIGKAKRVRFTDWFDKK